MIRPPAANSFFLFGPRGTGKTTWAKTAFPDSVYGDLLEAELFNELTANPRRLATYIPPGFEGRIVMDEVRRVPGPLRGIHRLIESGKYRFVLTGSSAHRLRRKDTNLLACRDLTLKTLKTPPLKLMPCLCYNFPPV